MKQRETVRIVATADLHSQHGIVEVPPGDVLILAGDLTARGSASEGADLLAWLAALPHRHKVVVAGNHDHWLDNPRAADVVAQAGAHYLLDAEVCVAGLRVWGAPWTPTYGSWAFQAERGADITAHWDRIPTGVDVLVTHGPARGYGDLASPLRDLGDRVGCEDLLRAVVRADPRHHVFGHIHEDPGTWQNARARTRHWNVTSSSGRRAVVTFDVVPGPWGRT